MAKRYTARFKFQAVMEVLTGQQSVAQAAKERNVHPNSINKWVVEFRARGHEIFEQKQKENEEKKKIERIERLLGQKEVEIALLENFLGRTD